MTALDQITPLSAERLAEIGIRQEMVTKGYDVNEPLPAAEQVRFIAEERDRLIDRDVPALLAEVDRLTAERDQARLAIQQAIAAANPEDVASFLNDYLSGVGGVSSGLPDLELLDEVRLRWARDAALATIDRVAHLQVVAHGCGGTVMHVVFAEHLHTALGLTSDGKGVA